MSKTSNNGAGDDVPARAIHVVAGLATSVSTDGTTGLLQFAAGDGEFSLTFPLNALPALRAMLDDVESQARQQRLGKENVHPRLPTSYRVGHSAELRGHVMVFFDEGTKTEILLVFPDEAAMRLGGDIQKNVISRMTPADRAKAVAGMSTPPPKRLILPGQ